MAAAVLEAAAQAVERLPDLLRLYWLLATGAVVVTLLPVPVPQAFKCVAVAASCIGLGLPLWRGVVKQIWDAAVPQFWFWHFYGLGVAWNLILLVLFGGLLCCSGTDSSAKAASLVALAAFQLHLTRRLWETHVIMVYPRGARMHLLAYAFGMSYYFVAPLSLVPRGVLAAEVAGLARWVAGAAGGSAGAGAGAMATPLQHAAALMLKSLPRGQHVVPVLVQRASATLQGALLGLSPLQGLGLAVFLLGNLLQLWAHEKLGRLAAASARDGGGGSSSSSGGARGYRLPRGGAFELVSCPHYLGEIVVYCGLALVARGSVESLLILAWVVVNLVLAAGATQQWYRATFPTYPNSRRALIPFVF